MKVLKFGGSSLATGDRIKNVANIIRQSTTKKKNPIVVVSAFGGITDTLISCGNKASSGDEGYLTIQDEIINRTLSIAKELFPKKEGYNTFINKLNPIIDEFKGLLKGIFLLKEMSDRSLALLLSFGERISALTLASYLTNSGQTSSFVDARGLIKTDHHHLKAQVDFMATNHLITEFFKKHKETTIITGFIASTFDGTTTVLGRGGSDYSASIFGAAIRADVIEIWTDVNGVLSADPRKVFDSFTIPQLTYDEASEISHFGAKVIYPPTVIPARKNNIPLLIKNSFQPLHPGTIINNDKSKENTSIKGVTSISKVSMITLSGGGLVGVPGSAAKLFQALSDQAINIILISQGSSENSISYVIDAAESDKAVKAQEKAFEKEIAAGLIEPAKVQNDLSIISIVGENMYSTPGIAGKMFRALGKNGINVYAIAQGSSELNISSVVHRDNEVKSLKVLHEMFFLSKTIRVNLFMTGTGLIATTLLKQIEAQREHLKKVNNIEICLIGLSNSRKMTFNKDGINLQSWQQELDNKGEKTDAKAFVQMCINANLPNSIFVDCTASGEIPAYYSQLLNHSISISTPNKISVSGEFGMYTELKEAARKNNVFFLHETTVGAGLPILNTLKNLKESGDNILSIEGVFSGSVSYIFNNFSASNSFSKVVSQAAEKGYTEPDPRIDLNGIDVRRKLVILSREAGFVINEKDFKIKTFLPKEVQNARAMEEFWEQIDKADAYFEKLLHKAKKNKSKLRFIGTITSKGASLALKEVGKKSPFYNLDGSDNMIVFNTERYKERPLVIQGPGAGAEVTASGIFAEILTIVTMLKDY